MSLARNEFSSGGFGLFFAGYGLEYDGGEDEGDACPEGGGEFGGFVEDEGGEEYGVYRFKVVGEVYGKG